MNTATVGPLLAASLPRRRIGIPLVHASEVEPSRPATPGNRRRLLAVPLLLLATLALADGGYIHAKAVLAQWLLERAWDAQLDGRDVLPWPGADTRPVARLRMPRLGIEQIVLSGDSGRTLAFGPGWAEASAEPAAHGTTVISAHRDTHFAFLRELQTGDIVEIESVLGSRRYRISGSEVIDARHHRLPLTAGADRLLLVTCWPFDALVAGGPERLVLSAEAVER